MGALPSRESHEGPNTIYFNNNNGTVALHVPLTPHYFPSADCLAFKEVHRVRNSQSCKYSFNIKEASAVLPDAAAAAFHHSLGEDWGPEMRAADPSVHYHDEDVAACLREHGLPSQPPSSSSSAMPCPRPAIEDRHELYRALVLEPTRGALVDTDAEMCELFAQEQRWQAARDVVRRHREQTLARQPAQCHSGRGGDDVRDPDAPPLAAVDADALAEAEAVPPPRVWLRPIPEAVMERMSMEDTHKAHAAYRRARSMRAGATDDAHGGGGASSSSSTGTGHDAAQYRDEAALDVLDLHGRPHASETTVVDERQITSYPSFTGEELPFEQEERYMDGRVHLVAHEGVNYIFAYNPTYVRAMGRTVAVDGSLVQARQQASTAAQSPGCRAPFTTTFTVATQHAEDFDNPNQRRAYELIQPIYARYYIPVLPVRVLGVDGLLPSSAAEHAVARERRRAFTADDDDDDDAPRAVDPLRGAPWLRGVAGDAAEEFYEEQTLPDRFDVAPPPVLRVCRFIHTAVGDKVLNRMSVLRHLTFREMCLHAGLPDAIARPVWGLVGLSDVPQLQFQREVELRLLAAIREVDDGDTRVRTALTRRHQWNDYVRFVNSPMHGFMVSAPPERRFRPDESGALHEIDADDISEENSDEHDERDEAAEEEEEEAHHSRPGRRARAPQTTTTQSVAAPTPARTHTTAAAGSHSSVDVACGEQKSSSTSARSAAHDYSAATSVADSRHGSGVAVGGARAAAARTASPSIHQARTKRTRERDVCMASGSGSSGVADSATQHTGADIHGGDDELDDEMDDLARYESCPVVEACGWAFKRRRLGLHEEVVCNPNLSSADWVPMVNPLSKDVALAELGVRVAVRGRAVLVRYTRSATRDLLYYLSQASAPIFCLPYVGPPQQCPPVRLHGVLRIPHHAGGDRRPPSTGAEREEEDEDEDEEEERVWRAGGEHRLPAPTPAQIRASHDAYAQGDVLCFAVADMDVRSPIPLTSRYAAHYRDDDAMREPVEAGVTSRLTLAQVPVKADLRTLLRCYMRSLTRGPAALPIRDGDGDDGRDGPATPHSNPYEHWPTLLDAPTACDGDVLAVCPRTHRWVRACTLILFVWFAALHSEASHPKRAGMRRMPVLEMFSPADVFAAEVHNLHDKLVIKNLDSEGTHRAMLRTRRFFSYNGIVELLLDGLRGVAEAQAYENKDDAGWLLLPPSEPRAVATATATAVGHRQHVECGSFHIWSFTFAGQRLFLGTKPRFVRLALQRQRQNQRRRLKRKGKDAPAAPVHGSQRGALAPDPSPHPSLSTGVAGPESESALDCPSSAQSRHSKVSSSASSSPSLTAARTMTATGSTASLQLASCAESNVVGSSSSIGSTCSGVPPTHAASLSVEHGTAQPAAPLHPRGTVTAIAGQRVAVHLPYAPLHVTPGDYLGVDERADMHECRQQHRSWMAGNGVFFDQTVKDDDDGAHAAPGRRGRRLRLVMPVGPHGLASGRLVALPRDVHDTMVRHPDSDVVAEAFAAAAAVVTDDGTRALRTASPRTVDAAANTYRWNPYRLQ
ncbi:hypothetical protein NESM_000255800 [Novymonas esmeraldas]|uniref:Uncharacterized protein n=1 Tax=Novymonas esmeraldas TaxID=1808958 RepID=A0AAW0FBW4_9TRYP